MNALQLATAKAHLDELKYGMKNEDVKRLDLRSFCVHTERMRKRVRISLYKLAPEWLKYVEEHIVPTIENEDDVIEKMKISTDTNPLLSKIEHSIMTGDCQTESIFDRAALIYRYYEQLKTTGMKDEDIVDADLTGMLGDYLVPFADRYKLRSDSCLYVLHVVKKYYRKDIKEYESFVAENYDQESSKSGTTNLINTQTTKSAETIKPKEIKVEESEVIEFRGERFIKTSWNGISVLKHERTGYYKAMCGENGKRFNNWRRNRKTIELLEIASEMLHLPIEVSDAGKPASEEMNCLLYRIRSGGSDAVEIGNQIQGYYIHPILFNRLCEWISPIYAFKVSELMAKIASEKAVDRTVESIKPKEIEVDENEVINIRDKRFRLYNYFGHQVYQNIETGWLNAGQFVKAVAKINGEQIKLAFFKRTDDWKLALEFGRRAILEQGDISNPVTSSKNSNENLEITQGKKSPLASNSEIEAQILSIYGNEYTKAKGSYVPYRVFQLVALWADKRHKLEVLEFLQALNENANAKQKNAYEILAEEKSKLEAEINDLKAKNESKNHSLNELEAELVSRAVKIEELASEIEDLTTPIDTRLAPPTIYAKYIDDNYVQLKHSSSELGPNVRTLRRESFNGAIECLKQAKAKLKEEGLLVNINGKLLIETSHIDKAFDLIHEIKDRKNESRTDRNAWFESQLSKLRTREQTSQLEGKIFELEYIQQHEELTPWALIPTDIKNRLNETSKDKGIDAVELTNEGEFLSIIQIKHHRGNYLRKDELQTFFNKCSQERYKNMKKRLLLHNCKVSDKLKNMIYSHGIEIEVLLN